MIPAVFMLILWVDAGSFYSQWVSYAVFNSVLGSNVRLWIISVLWFTYGKLTIGVLTSHTYFSAELQSAQCRLSYSAFALVVLDASLVQIFSHVKIL